MGEAGIREIFMNEAREIITNLESEIVQLEDRAGDQETINRVFRYIHTLKGSSGIAGFRGIYDFTHKLENLFDQVPEVHALLHSSTPAALTLSKEMP